MPLCHTVPLIERASSTLTDSLRRLHRGSSGRPFQLSTPPARASQHRLPVRGPASPVCRCSPTMQPSPSSPVGVNAAWNPNRLCARLRSRSELQCEPRVSGLCHRQKKTFRGACAGSAPRRGTLVACHWIRSGHNASPTCPGRAARCVAAPPQSSPPPLSSPLFPLEKRGHPTVLPVAPELDHNGAPGTIGGRVKRGLSGRPSAPGRIARTRLRRDGRF